MPQPTVLITDDDKLTRWSLSTLLNRLGCAVRQAATGGECLAVLREERPDLVMLDIVLPDGDGLRILAEIRAGYPDIPVLLMTADPSCESRQQGVRLGASAYLAKPVDAATLEAAIAEHGALARPTV